MGFALQFSKAIFYNLFVWVSFAGSEERQLSEPYRSIVIQFRQIRLSFAWIDLQLSESYASQTHTHTHHQRHWRHRTCPWSSSFSVDHMYLVVCECVCVCVCSRVYQHRTCPWNISISAVEASTPPPPSPTPGPSNLNGDLPIKKLSVNTKQFS
jgi:hypothetical protein